MIYDETTETRPVDEQFKQNAKQVVSRELRATQLKKVDYFTDSRGQRLLCVFVEVDPTVAKSIYDQIVTETRRNLSPQSDCNYRPIWGNVIEYRIRLDPSDDTPPEPPPGKTVFVTSTTYDNGDRIITLSNGGSVRVMRDSVENYLGCF